MHLRDLRYFVAVAEERHVTRAAERLYVSQPALSKQVRALERHLGFDLLRRLPRGVDLTPEGEALLPRARDLLAAWDRDVRAARAAGARRTLVVGMQTAVGRDLQRAALARLRAEGWSVSLRLVGWSDPTAGLADGTSDVAFCWLPLTGPGLAWRVLVREDRWVALPAAHRLAARAEIAFSELLDEPFVALTGVAGALRDFWLATDARGGCPPVVAVEAEGPDEVFEAIGSGLGVALLAEGNAALYPRPGVAYRPVTGLAPAELAVVWRAGTEEDPAVAAFLDALGPGVSSS
ncbi:MAG TPA: LysR family transcriptional regulator [Pseudonocardia sp.]|nr:LysR family transcriptional regulator [Pseudonocardia sp.]